MDALRVEPVTADTYEAVIGLDVRAEQRSFVAPNVRSLADAWVHPAARPLALWAGDDPVGFALLHPAGGGHGGAQATVVLVRFMIDARFQGRGLGRLGVRAVIDRAAADGYDRLRLSVLPGSRVARALHAAEGFTETGEIDDGEVVMELPLGR